MESAIHTLKYNNTHYKYMQRCQQRDNGTCIMQDTGFHTTRDRVLVSLQQRHVGCMQCRSTPAPRPFMDFFQRTRNRWASISRIAHIPILTCLPRVRTSHLPWSPILSGASCQMRSTDSSGIWSPGFNLGNQTKRLLHSGDLSWPTKGEVGCVRSTTT